MPYAILLLQSPSASISAQQLPTPFAGSQGVEQKGVQGPHVAAGGTPRHDDGAGAFGRAASMPAAALARSASGQHEDSLRLGESLLAAVLYIYQASHAHCKTRSL